MSKFRVALAAVAGLAVLLAVAGLRSATPALRAALCSLPPGPTMAVVRVDQDTTLPFAVSRSEAMSASRTGREGDAYLATDGTLMPAARVRVLQLDSVTRAILGAAGITNSQPAAFLRAAPYRADCRTVRWTDTIPFVVRGEVGFVRGTLAPTEQWVEGVPVIIVADAWNYPYPRRRGLVFRVPPDAPLASPQAVFSLTVLLDAAPPGLAGDSARRARALAWARAHPAAAELEPVRNRIRQAVLEPDLRVASAAPSRLRGTYRVDLEVGGERVTWYFRTHERPGYSWHGGDPAQSTAALVAAPYISGYRLVGYSGPTPDSIPATMLRPPAQTPLVWLAISDRPTKPGNAERRTLHGVFEFIMSAAPESMWDALELFVPKMNPVDSMMLTRVQRLVPRSRKQPQIPLTLRLDARGIHADTVLRVAGRELKLRLERTDTLSNTRPF